MRYRFNWYCIVTNSSIIWDRPINRFDKQTQGILKLAEWWWNLFLNQMWPSSQLLNLNYWHGGEIKVHTWCPVQKWLIKSWCLCARLCGKNAYIYLAIAFGRTLWMNSCKHWCSEERSRKSLKDFWYLLSSWTRLFSGDAMAGTLVIMKSIKRERQREQLLSILYVFLFLPIKQAV